MNILGIETSCDETACGIVADGRRLLSSVVDSQIAMHQRFGGVVPEIAARGHLEKMDGVVELALAQAQLGMDDVDAIAVTQGPGLIGALLVGISYAKSLALARQIPLVPVNHVHAHVHGALLGVDVATEDVFPCLALVASGGHTNLFYMPSPTDFRLHLYSVDDACGECFDKVGKMLGFPYPGGPKIEKAAASGDPKKIPMPRIAGQPGQEHFSYSGLKTFMVNLVASWGAEQTTAQMADICAAFQFAALEQIGRKLKKSLRAFPAVKSVIVAGGVSANQNFRQLLQHVTDLPLHFPALQYCSDNGAMIAALAYHEFARLGSPAFAPEQLGWDAYSRYPYDEALLASH